MPSISLEGLDKAEVLAALYNASKPQGMGFLHYDPEPMSAEEARSLLETHTYFDYLKGRVMKVDLGGDELDTWGYDRDNGEGSAAKAIEALRETGDVNSSSIQEKHGEGKSDAAEKAREFIRRPSVTERQRGMVTFTLGGSDVADVLGPAIDKAIDSQKGESDG